MISVDVIWTNMCSGVLGYVNELLPAEHGVRVCSEHVGIHDEPRVVHNQRDPAVLVRVRTIRRLTLLVLRDCKNNKFFVKISNIDLKIFTN